MTSTFGFYEGWLIHKGFRASAVWEILIKMKLNICIKVFIRACDKKLFFKYLGYYCSKCVTGLQPSSCCGWATPRCCPEIESRIFWALVITESCDLLQMLNFHKIFIWNLILFPENTVGRTNTETQPRKKLKQGNCIGSFWTVMLILFICLPLLQCDFYILYSYWNSKAGLFFLCVMW